MGKNKNEVPTLKNNTKLNGVTRDRASDSFIVVGNQKVERSVIDKAKKNGMTDEQINNIIYNANKSDMKKEYSKYSTAMRTDGKKASDVRENTIKKYGVTRDDFDKGFSEYKNTDALHNDEKESFKKNAVSKYYDTYQKAFGKGAFEALANNAEVARTKKQLMNEYNLTNKEFEDLFNEYKTQKDTEFNKEKTQQFKDFSKEHQVLGTIASTGLNLLTPFEGAKNMVKDATLGINTGSDYLISDLVNSSREGVKETIDSNIGDTIYDLGTSGIDMLAQLGVGLATGGATGAGTVMGALQSGQTANDALRDSHNNGNSRGEALSKAALEALASYGLSKYGVDELVNINPTSLLGNIGKGIVTEGLEEGIENIALNAIDKGVSGITGSVSNEDAMRNQLMDMGYSKEEADKLVRTSRFKEVLMDAAAGGFMGGIGAGARSITKGINYNSAVNDLLNGKSVGEVTSPYDIAPEVKNTVPKDINPTVNATVNPTVVPNITSNVNNDVNSKISSEPQTTNLTTPDPQIGNGNKRTRGYYESVDLPEDFKTQLNDKIYNQLSNTETYEKALNVREEASSINDAVSKFREMLGRHEAASVPLGYNLAQELIDAGEMSAATDIVNDIMSQMTKAGQFTQAAYLTALKNNPLAAMTALEKEIKKLNDVGSKQIKNWKELKLTDAEKQTLASVKTGDAETLNNVMDSIYDRLAEDYQFSKWDKFYDLTKTFMLLNPRTHIRNTGANMISTPLRSLTDRTKAGLESVYSLFNKDYQRTSSFKGGNPEQKAMATEVSKTAFKDDVDNKWLNSAKGQIESRAQLWKDGKNGTKVKERAVKRAERTVKVLSTIDSMVGGKLTDSGIIDAVNNHIDNKITGSRLENMRQFDYLLLGDIEDEPFVRKNFVNSLANYMAAQDIHRIEDIPDEAIQLAKSEALKATFKDDNFLTNALSGLKQSNFNKKTHLFDVLMPFVKTPANLAMRGLEYSPAGFAKSIIEFNKLKSSGDITNADISNFIGELAKNTTGTGLIALGYLLAKNGIITGEYDDNKNARNFQKMQGYKEYAINLGDKYITYDWAQPSSIPLIIGTALYEGSKNTNEDESQLKNTLSSVKNGMINASDAWFNLSPLQGLSEVLKGGNNSYGDTSITKNLMDKVLEYPQTLIPSVLGATARTVDPTMRNTTDVTSDAKTYLNQVLAKIPGASMLLPASYDTWGEERKRSDNVGDAAVAQYLNPATTGYYNESNSDIDEYIKGVYDATGEDTVFPKTAEYTLTADDGSKRKLNNEEYSEKQKVQGQKQAELVRAFSQIADSQGLSKSEQAEALSNIYSAAKDSTEEELYNFKTSMSDTEYGIFKEGAEAYAQYQVDKQMAKRYDLDYKKYKELYDEGGTYEVKKYAEKRDTAKDLSEKYDIDMNAKSIETAEKNGQTAEEYAQRTARVKEINKQYGLDMEKSTYDSYLDKGANDDQIVFIENMKSEIKNARPSSEKKNTSLKQSEVISYLDKSNLSDSEKSAIIKYSLNPDSKYVQRGLSTFGDSALYQIMLNKVLADSEEYGGNEDGSVSQAEAKAFIATLPKSERQSWYYVLIGK